MCEACRGKTRAASRHLSRRQGLALGLGAGLVVSVGATHLVLASDNPPPKPENAVSSDEALARLMEGNARYVSGIARRHDFVAEREALVGGQNPYAGILSCADSRIAPEYAFDTGRGDLFVCRVAGNFVTPDILASFEFAVDFLKTPLLMVLGHESCGAVKAAISAVKDGKPLPG